MRKIQAKSKQFFSKPCGICVNVMCVCRHMWHSENVAVRGQCSGDGFLLQTQGLSDHFRCSLYSRLTGLKASRKLSLPPTVSQQECWNHRCEPLHLVFHGFWKWNPSHPCVASEASCELTENLWETQKRGNGFNFMVIAQSWHQNPKEEYIKIKSKANLNHEHEYKSESKNPLQMLIKLDTGH